MSPQLKETENILAECIFGAYTATLTSNRLIIKSAISDESFPLRSITGIGVYDDVVQYEQSLKAAKDKNTRKSTTIIMLGIIPMAILLANGELTLGMVSFAVFFAIGLTFLFRKTPELDMQSVLKIMQYGGDKTFTFAKTDSEAYKIKGFIEKVTETLS